jgi:hypothetical protein
MAIVITRSRPEVERRLMKINSDKGAAKKQNFDGFERLLEFKHAPSQAQASGSRFVQ